MNDAWEFMFNTVLVVAAAVVMVFTLACVRDCSTDNDAHRRNVAETVQRAKAESAVECADIIRAIREPVR